MKYHLLGQFTYCGQTITLTSREDELEFVVTSEGNRNTPSRRTYASLGLARDKFELLARELVSYCSTSDLHLFMQQDAPVCTAPV